MADTTMAIDVPGFGSEQLRLLYLRRYSGAQGSGVLNGLDHLQAIRVGVRRGMLEDRYNTMKPSATALLISEARDIPFTHVIAPPSRLPFAREYAVALANARNAINLSDHIAASSRPPRATGGHTSSQALFASWTTSDIGPLSSGATVLLVDDVVSTGSTMAALVAVIRKYVSSATVPLVALAALWVALNPGSAATDASRATRKP